jgi:hypothetical protein
MAEGMCLLLADTELNKVLAAGQFGLGESDVHSKKAGR